MITRFGWCKECKSEFYYVAESWRGRPRAFCDKHDKSHKREVLNNRVKKHRARARQDANKIIQHIGVSDIGKTYCGLPLSNMLPHSVEKQLGPDRVKLCKKCAAIMDRLEAEAIDIHG